MPVEHRSQLVLTSVSVEQTYHIGVVLGKLLTGGDIVCLSGDLGVGKTALTSGIGQGWGARQPVNSPTFVFIHEHSRLNDEIRLYHLDCYRLASEDDAMSIGLEDILSGDDIVVMEWPERVINFLPAERLWITLETQDETTRHISIAASGSHYLSLIDSLYNALS